MYHNNLIYYEIVAVSTLHREMGGDAADNTDFTGSKVEIKESEDKMNEIVTYVKAYETKVHVTDNTESNLHNILANEIMSEEITYNLLNIQEKGTNLCSTFSTERFNI